MAGAANGGDLLVDVLESLGVDCAFGIVSVHNLPLIDALNRRMRFVPVRHEAAAVNAADGYSRASRRLGVAVTSTGTGAGNAAGSMIESLTAGSSVLHVTGQIPSQHLGSTRGVIHETKDQLGMLTAVSKYAWSVGPRDAAGQVLRTAAATALAAPTGPVSVEWPIDLQYAFPRDGNPVAVPRSAAPDSTAVESAADLIASASRPLVWLGGGARDAREKVRHLVEKLQAGVLTSNAGRGVIREDDQRCIGNFAANPACVELLADADLLVSIGTHFRSNETRDYTLQLPSSHVQIDVDPAALGRVYPCDVGLVGETATVVAALLDATTKRVLRAEDGWLKRVEEARRAVRRQLRQSIGPHGGICDAMRRVLPENAVVARDVTIPSSSWGNRLLEIYDPWSNVFARGGGIGQGLSMGLGAALADPERPAVVMVGDGGLVVHLGELLTVAQERPWLVTVLFNDGGYGVLRNMQDQHVGRRSGVDLLTPDFGALCSSIPLRHSRVTDVSDFEPTLRAAVDERQPWVVEVDVDAIGPMPTPFVPPVSTPR